MSNGHVCCLLGVCCEPNSAAQRQALISEMENDGFEAEAAAKTADWILANFDLAPAGSLTEFKAKVGAMARQGKGPKG